MSALDIVIDNPEKSLNTSEDDLRVIVENTLIIGDLYKHCVGCSTVFEGDYNKPLIDVKKLTGEGYLTAPFVPYEVTSGYCPPCFSVAMEKFDER